MIYFRKHTVFINKTYLLNIKVSKRIHEFNLNVEITKWYRAFNFSDINDNRFYKRLDYAPHDYYFDKKDQYYES